MNKPVKSAIISAITALIIFSPAIAGANLTPVWNPVYIKYGTIGKALQFNVSAWDPDGDRLSYYATSLPLYASFDKERQLFSWIPKETGTYLVRFRVFDNFYSFSDLEVILEISNKSPVFGSDFGNSNIGGGSGAGGENRPQIIIINTQPAQPIQSVVQPSVAPVAKPKTVLPDVDNGENKKETEVVVNNNDQNDHLSFAATLIGIADNILLNPWLLIVLVIVLLTLLYRCAKKREMLEQELALKRNHEA